MKFKFTFSLLALSNTDDPKMVDTVNSEIKIGVSIIPNSCVGLRQYSNLKTKTLALTEINLFSESSHKSFFRI